jgi:hypothetical protein
MRAVTPPCEQSIYIGSVYDHERNQDLVLLVEHDFDEHSVHAEVLDKPYYLA